MIQIHLMPPLANHKALVVCVDKKRRYCCLKMLIMLLSIMAVANCGGNTVKNTINQVYGTINVSANVSGASVMITELNQYTELSESKSYTFVNILPGNYTVRIEYDYKGTKLKDSKTVNVKNGTTESVSFLLNPQGNQMPIANAGNDARGFAGVKYINEGWNGEEIVFTPYDISYTLDGCGSSDPDGDEIRYSWKQISGPTAILSDVSNCKKSFVPNLTGDYEFELTVIDEFIPSQPDYVKYEILNPEGKIAYYSNYHDKCFEVYTVNADGSEHKQITMCGYDSYNPSWCGNGTTIVYGCHPSTESDVCRMNQDGSNNSIITNNSLYNMTPDCSPDSNHIAYSKGNLTNNLLYIMDINGDNDRELAAISGELAFSPNYSLDGSKIAFIVQHNYCNFEIYVVNVDGTGTKRITDNETSDYDVTWTNENKLLFTNTSCLGDNIQHLYTVNSDGTGLVDLQIPSGIQKIVSPRYSNDGKYIYFINQDGELSVMLSDGSLWMSYGLAASAIDYHSGP